MIRTTLSVVTTVAQHGAAALATRGFASRSKAAEAAKRALRATPATPATRTKIPREVKRLDSARVVVGAIFKENEAIAEAAAKQNQIRAREKELGIDDTQDSSEQAKIMLRAILAGEMDPCGLIPLPADATLKQAQDAVDQSEIDLNASWNTGHVSPPRTEAPEVIREEAETLPITHRETMEVEKWKQGDVIWIRTTYTSGPRKGVQTLESLTKKIE